jgi:hypothetical protein
MLLAPLPSEKNRKVHRRPGSCQVLGATRCSGGGGNAFGGKECCEPTARSACGVARDPAQPLINKVSTTRHAATMNIRVMSALTEIVRRRRRFLSRNRLCLLAPDDRRDNVGLGQRAVTRKQGL